jgi:hypothetical protein
MKLYRSVHAVPQGGTGSFLIAFLPKTDVLGCAHVVPDGTRMAFMPQPQLTADVELEANEEDVIRMRLPCPDENLELADPRSIPSAAPRTKIHF